MNIDELERLAREADEGYSGAHPRDSNNWKANEAFCYAASPDVMAKLIAVVRAAEAYVGPDFEPDAGTRGADLRQSLAALKADA